MSQTRALYPDNWGSFLANVDVLQAFGTADRFTAEFLSEMTGQDTPALRAMNRSAGRTTGDLKPAGPGVANRECPRLALQRDELDRNHLFVSR